MVDLLKRCSQVYLLGTHEPEHSSYASFAKDTRVQWNRLPIAVDFTDDNPYEVASELFAACERGRFSVYRHGAAFENSHPLSVADRNLWFRAVHDWYGHYGAHDSAHYDFSFEGELRAWVRHEAQYSAESQQALFCETVLQLAVYAVTGDFVEYQKCVIASPELIAEVRAYASKL